MVSTCEVLVLIITQHYSGFSDLLLAKFSDCPLNIKQKVSEVITEMINEQRYMYGVFILILQLQTLPR